LLRKIARISRIQNEELFTAIWRDRILAILPEENHMNVKAKEVCVK
jgi:hypothetical protein